MTYKKIISLILAICLLSSVMPVVSFAETTPSSVVDGYEYTYTYADIDFDKKDTWNDTVNFNHLGYSFGTGEITIDSAGIGDSGNSAKLVTNGSGGNIPAALKVSFDIMLPGFSTSDVVCDIKFGSTWHSGLHISADSSNSHQGKVTLQGAAVTTIEDCSWHNITYIIRNSLEQYDVYFDNTFIKTLSVTSGAGDIDSVEISGKSNNVYVDNACTTVIDYESGDAKRTISSHCFEDDAIGGSGWIGANTQIISGSAEITDAFYYGTSGKSLLLYNSGCMRFFLSKTYTVEDAYGETTQINDIRADASEGIVVYSMDFLFKDFLTEKSFHINSLLTDGTYSWKLGGFKVYPTETSESYFVTAGCSTGVKSSAITTDTWYNIKVAVDLDNEKIYYFFEDTLIAEAAFSGVAGVYRASVAADAANCSVMYLDNVNITCYTKSEKIPSVFESDEQIKSDLSGYGALHLNSGCIVSPDGTKLLSEHVPHTSADGDVMVDSSVLKALLDVSEFAEVYTESSDGVIYYSLQDCVAKAGKTAVYDDSAANGGFYVIGDSAFTLPSGDELQSLNDYIFYLRPDDSKIAELYQSSALKGAHPRLLASDEVFDILRAMAAVSGSDMEALSKNIISSADWCVRQNNILTYTKNTGDELRMNGVASSFDLYMYTVAVAWQIVRNTNPTKAANYVQYAWKQMEAIASFPDWNPAHHIDQGIFSSGFAIAYDIMYDAWTDEQKQIIEKAALDNGLSAYMKSYQVDYSAMTNAATVSNNHNAMTNGNAVLLSLAFMDIYPEECSYVLSNALRGMENMLINYAPEGGWWEGVYYSCLNMEYLCPAFSALENVFGSCLRLDTVQGFDGAGDFIEVVQSDVGIYNFADAEPGSYMVELWYQNHFGRDCIDDFKDIAHDVRGGGKEEAKAFIAGTDISESAAKLPLDMYFVNAQLVAMHDSYDDGQTFAGIKAGDTVYDHSHFDSGSFVFDSMGVRWAHDMGKDDYNLDGFWDTDGGRWKIFLNRAESHNTVIVDPDMNPDYAIGSTAPVTTFETSSDSGVVKIDTSGLYAGRLSDAERAFCFTDNRKSLVVRDELTTLSGKTSDIYWMMYTQADADIDKEQGRVILTDKTDATKKLLVEFLCSSDFDIIYEVAAPLDGTPVVSGQKTNSGFYRLALKTCTSGNVSVTVKLTPMHAFSASVSDYDVPISEWSVSSALSKNRCINIDSSVLTEDSVAVFALYNSSQELINISITNIDAGSDVDTIALPFEPTGEEQLKFMLFNAADAAPLIKAVCTQAE